MTRPPRSNRNLALRLLLLCGYCFFFASQFNHQYYSIANNFVYKSTGEKKAAGCKNTRNPAHLSIDKRFSCPSPFQKTDPSLQQRSSSCIVLNQTVQPQPAPYPVPNLPINTFRGPPAI
jgi:hypothetical protein